MRKLLSIISSIAVASSMLFSLATVSSAAIEEDRNLAIKVDAEVDQYGYYAVSYTLEYDNNFVLSQRDGGRGAIYYTGSGIYAYQIAVEGITGLNTEDPYSGDVYMTNSTYQSATAAIKSENNTTYLNWAKQSDGEIVSLWQTAESSILLGEFSTNIAAADATKEEVIEKFSNFGSCKVVISNVSDVMNRAISDNDNTTYGVSADGETIHPDAAYAIKTSQGSTPVATTITLDKTSVSLKMGETETATVVATVNDGTPVVWTTDKADVATVNGGVITAVGAGSATITATAGTATATVAVTVAAADPVQEDITDKNVVVEGNFGEGKTLVWIATVLDKAELWAKKVSIIKKVNNEEVDRQDSDRSLADILGGVTTEGTNVTGSLAIGVLATDYDAETTAFEFELR